VESIVLLLMLLGMVGVSGIFILLIERNVRCSSRACGVVVEKRIVPAHSDVSGNGRTFIVVNAADSCVLVVEEKGVRRSVVVLPDEFEGFQLGDYFCRHGAP